MNEKTYISDSYEKTVEIGKQFASELSGINDIEKPLFIAMYGDLGAGKTAFVSGMARCLAPEDNVSSPTYSIINMYEGRNRFYHLDLYRIKSEDDLYSVGFYELFDDPDCIIACEWCENIPSSLPKNYIKVQITGQGEDNRIIKISEVRK